MVLVTQPLKIAPVPEQQGIATMRPDMVNRLRDEHKPESLALHTARILGQHLIPELDPPCCAVPPTHIEVRPFMFPLNCMRLTVPTVGEGAAPDLWTWT